ncbi:alpha/beta hydrolase [Edaphobacter sp. 12200R-103]|uniref:alpha/beta hydrolase n=1 Tax=Edaphobacter sp. 12200R-103 TaxID=2703788 RepID=UPI00138BE4AF|nr:alpha/beta family hydrolase [Edaphobacter sp. 12200R-103]QHS51046.1 alpha/beta hydrolase [Edaphobacter sp. 12200R-103]
MSSSSGSVIRSIDDLRGPAGKLEAVLNTGSGNARFAALVCHPHPLGGGTMHNKVVYHAMKVFSGLGLPVLRFNFRGVGLSEGTHDHGPGELNDARAALDWLDANLGLPVLVAGFSFGSFISLQLGCGDPLVHGLVGLGVPYRAEGRSYAYEFLERCPQPKLFISGAEDQFGPRALMNPILKHAAEPREIIWIEGAEHFFQGVPSSPGAKLVQMQKALRSWVTQTFDLGLPNVEADASGATLP